MGRSATILCGGVSPPSQRGARGVLRVKRLDPSKNLKIQIDKLSGRLAAYPSGRAADLLEIAAYVYSADQMVKREGTGVDIENRNWYRTFDLHIPVREPEFWNGEEIRSQLGSLLQFLSDDKWNITFHDGRVPQPSQGVLGLQATEVIGFTPTHVDLFSGGLDSLAGAAQAIETSPTGVLFVSHISTSKVGAVQKRLLTQLRSSSGANIVHVPVTVNKDKALSVESTQRTRSFLFLAIAAAVVSITGCSRIRVWENGVVAWNTPISESLIGARATRTAHPRVLADAAALISLVLGRQIHIENPFLWKTRAEVVSGLMATPFRHLMKASVSCGGTRRRTNMHPHCGVCSQCLDRRFGLIAAGAGNQDDPVVDYERDLFVAPAAPDEVRHLADGIIRLVQEVPQMTPRQFFAAYSQFADGLSAVPGKSADWVGKSIYELFVRYSESVQLALQLKLKEHAGLISSGRVSGQSLLSMAFPGHGGGGTPARAVTDLPAFEILTVQGIEQASTDGYRRARAAMSEFDLFIDTSGGEAAGRSVSPDAPGSRLAIGEMQCLSDIAFAQIAVVAHRLPSMKNSTTISACKKVEKARRKVDRRLRGREFEVFKTIRRGSSNIQKFKFDPPPGFRFCIIRPL